MYSCHVFLISSASVRSLPFLSLIAPIFAWNVPKWQWRPEEVAQVRDAALWRSPRRWRHQYGRRLRRTVQKGLNDQDNHDGVVTHLEPDILECKVKWAFGSNTMSKNSGGDGILAEPFQILTDDVVKVLHSVCQQIWKTQQWPQDWKRSACIPIPKNAQTTAQLHSRNMLVK